MTDSTGCAVIANLDAGSQTLSYNTPGYVDKDSVQAVNKVVTIGAGTIAQATGLYDLAGKIDTTIVDDSTPAQVATWPTTVALDHAQRSTPTLFTTPTDATKANASTGVFPFSSSYKTYVGSCTGNDPSNPLYTNAGAAPGAQVNPGETKSVTLTMRKVTLTLPTAADATGATGLIVPETAAPAMAPASPQVPCADTVTYAGLPTSGMNITFPLPYGVWRVCAYKKTTGPTRYYTTKPGTAWNSGSSALDKPVIVTTPTTTTPYAPRLGTTLGSYPGTGSSSLTC